jgi:hypothetical protein
MINLMKSPFDKIHVLLLVLTLVKKMCVVSRSRKNATGGNSVSAIIWVLGVVGAANYTP